ncbi:MAG: TraB/GumN family protein [Phenylobacterium sp.]
MWRVSDRDSQIYLFGTLHALKPAVRWRTPLYDRVLAQAGTVWFEADMESGDPDAIRLLIQRYGSDPDVPLSRKLPAGDVAELSRQTDLARIDHLRPWAAALMLSVQPALARGATADRGADLTITRAARSDAKRVRTFETLEDQARMFASLPRGSEVHYLANVIHERSLGPRARLPFQPASLEAAWMAGRLGSGEVAAMKADNIAFYEALLKRRNLAWADTLAAELGQSSGVELVNVGALHMVGEDGLPALLKARGFRVERVQ